MRERIAEEVTRPAWGETKPRINVYPGRTYHFDGRAALYVRSRKDSDDYKRMHRQRCFLTAMANQLDVVSVLRNFGAWRRRWNRACVPISRATSFPTSSASSAGSTRSGLSRSRSAAATSRAGARTTASRNVGAMRTTAREAILQLRPDTGRDVETARRACWGRLWSGTITADLARLSCSTRRLRGSTLSREAHTGFEPVLPP